MIFFNSDIVTDNIIDYTSGVAKIFEEGGHSMEEGGDNPQKSIKTSKAWKVFLKPWRIYTPGLN